jgi:hypothetical protein
MFRYKNPSGLSTTLVVADFYDLSTQGKDVTAYEPFIAQVRAREI